MTEHPPRTRLPESLEFLRPIVVDDLGRVGNTNDGGYVLPMSKLAGIEALISFGVSRDWSFEKGLKEIIPNLVIHAYDHTVGERGFVQEIVLGVIRMILLKSNFQEMRSRLRTYLGYRSFFSGSVIHHRERIFNRVDRATDATIQKTFDRLIDVSRVLVKMDIDGGEYRVTSELLEYSRKIDVLLVEFHDTEPYRELFVTQVKNILVDFEIVHVHGNNFGGIANDGLPEVLEITFVNRRLVRSGAPRRHQLPLAGVDSPNDPTKEELCLRFG